MLTEPNNTQNQVGALRCLVYFSRGTRPFESPELQTILQKSRFNNSRVGVTGLLVYLKGSFFQLLEGPPEAVEATYQRISRDPRHQTVTIVSDAMATRRHFPQWTMGFPSPNAAVLSRLGGYSDFKNPGSKELALLKSHGSKVFDAIVSHAKSN